MRSYILIQKTVSYSPVYSIHTVRFSYKEKKLTEFLFPHLCIIHITCNLLLHERTFSSFSLSSFLPLSSIPSLYPSFSTSFQLSLYFFLTPSLPPSILHYLSSSLPPSLHLSSHLPHTSLPSSLFFPSYLHTSSLFPSSIKSSISPFPFLPSLLPYLSLFSFLLPFLFTSLFHSLPASFSSFLLHLRLITKSFAAVHDRLDEPSKRKYFLPFARTCWKRSSYPASSVSAWWAKFSLRILVSSDIAGIFADTTATGFGIPLRGVSEMAH